MAVKEDCGKIGGPQECAGCGKKIHDKFLLKVATWKSENFETEIGSSLLDTCLSGETGL